MFDNNLTLVKTHFILQDNLTESDITILEKWQAAEVKLYCNLYATFQKRIDEYGRDEIAKEVSKLRRIREKLKITCKVQENKFQKGIKTATTKYLYSVPFNPNAIGYISG